MSWVDDDLAKLKNYAKALGLTVKFKSSNDSKDASAEYDGESKTIYLYENFNKSKTLLIMCFIHELGHHREFLDKNKKDGDLLTEALTEERPNKTQRMALYISESNAALYMPIIRDELGLKLSRYKIAAEAALDQWIAKIYYETGKYPTLKLTLKERKKFRLHMRKKYE